MPRMLISVLPIALAAAVGIGLWPAELAHESAPSATQSSASPTAPRTPSASVKQPDTDNLVGAIFSGSSTDHNCTGSVIASSTGDLVLTAAHCVGTSSLTFAPAYDNGARPFGTWKVTAVFVDKAWQQSGSPADDVAVLRVAATTGSTRSIQSTVGGGLAVGSAPKEGTRVRVTAYNEGSDEAVSCVLNVTSRTVDGVRYPEFDCPGLVDGSSGSPWISRVDGVPTVVGVLGGLEQGGCTSDISYSAPLGDQVKQLITRAESGASGDTDTGSPSSSC